MAVSLTSATQYTNSLDALKGASELTHYLHPDFRYYKPDWDMVRDCIAGSRRMKEKGELYLPALGDGGTEYAVYKERAVFTNLTARTLSGWLGTVFRRPIKLTGIQDSQRKRFDAVTPTGVSANAYSKKLLQEVLAVGRVGVLVDRDANGREAPYAATYLAENILCWREKMIDGITKPVYVLLREIVEQRHYLDDPAQARSEVVQRLLSSSTERGAVLRPRYRVLRLDDNGDYVQDIYEFENKTDGKGKDFKLTTGNIKPMLNGAPFKEIPFWIAGPNGVDYQVQKSPAYDIATLNIAHYRTSAQLEHGRYFTALPVYYVQQNAGGEEESEYTIGPSVVWEVPAEAKPGILEYFGTGLKALTDSLIEKENHVEQLGGRVAGAGARKQGSDNADVFAAKQSNETSILLGATDAVGELMTRALRFMLAWDNAPSADTLVVSLNQDFKLQSVGARELRAVALLYQSGILPVDELYRVLQESEYLSEAITLDEFKKKLDDLAQFPNQPDVAAMHEGYPDAATKFQVEEGAAGRDHELGLQDNQGELDMEQTIQQQEFDRQEANKDRKSEEKKAKDTAKVAAATAKTAAKAKPASGTKPAAKPKK